MTACRFALRCCLLVLIAITGCSESGAPSPEDAAKIFLKARFQDPAEGLRVVRNSEWPLVVAFDYVRLARTYRQAMSSLPQSGSTASEADRIENVFSAVVPRDAKLKTERDAVDLARRLATDITREQAKELAEKLSSLAKKHPARGPIPSYSVERVELDGDRAQVTIRDQAKTMTLIAVREDGKWYINVESFLKQEAEERLEKSRDRLEKKRERPKELREDGPVLDDRLIDTSRCDPSDPLCDRHRRNCDPNDPLCGR